MAGAFPTAALAEEIETEHPERIRALFVSCGNPVHSAPGRDLERAFKRLELVVSIDLYQNETANYADYLLPATDMLERADFPVSWTMLQLDPHAQYTPAVVPPKFERREEWRIFSDLAVASGAPLLSRSLCQLMPRLNALLGPFGRELTPDHLLALLLRWGGQTTLKTLRKIPEGVALRPNQPGSFLGKRVFTKDRRVHLDAPRLLADLPRLETYARSVTQPDDRLFLIGRRQRKSHNSWMHNLPRMRPEAAPHALMHPDDAAERKVEEGALILVEGPEGTMSLPARITDDVARGVIAIPHGWGHAGTGLSFASTLGGGNINKVLPGGEMEISGQAIMLAHRVRVRRHASDARTARESGDGVVESV
ncbi:MAG: molybdopterin dinucleotide binding domain-containing protein [Myxococcota bacterium]